MAASEAEIYFIAKNLFIAKKSPDFGSAFDVQN